MGFKGRTFGDCARLIMGCSGEESKAGKGGVIVWGGTNMGK